jgi:hypothetical protein
MQNVKADTPILSGTEQRRQAGNGAQNVSSGLNISHFLLFSKTT